MGELKKKSSPTITVAIPCYDEALTIAKVIRDFRSQLPEADIVVFNNNSTDNSVNIAKENGATVVDEKKQGKGYVLQRMFRTIDTDILIMVDGDGTYFADDVHRLLESMDSGADMAVGNRLHQKKGGVSYSHQLANTTFRFLLNHLFRTNFKDILSGYRAMKRDFYQHLPLLTSGFEIETELTLQSLDRGYSIKEIPIKYTDRPKGSFSKIRFKDSYRIILTIISLLRDYRPMIFFGYLGGFFILAGLLFGSIIINEYYATGFIKRVPTAILSIALIIVGVNALISGLILSAMNRRQKETEIIIRQIDEKNRKFN